MLAAGIVVAIATRDQSSNFFSANQRFVWARAQFLSRYITGHSEYFDGRMPGCQKLEADTARDRCLSNKHLVCCSRLSTGTGKRSARHSTRQPATVHVRNAEQEDVYEQWRAFSF